VHRWRVFQHHHVYPLAAPEAEFGNRRCAIRQETLFVGWINPGTCHDFGAVERSDVLFVSPHDGVDHVGGNETLLHQQGFQRFGAQRRVGLRAGLMTVMGDIAHAASLGAAQAGSK
jgi:hypothetical protein